MPNWRLVAVWTLLGVAYVDTLVTAILAFTQTGAWLLIGTASTSCLIVGVGRIRLPGGPLFRFPSDDDTTPGH